VASSATEGTYGCFFAFWGTTQEGEPDEFARPCASRDLRNQSALQLAACMTMARRSRKGDAAALGFLILVGVPIYLAMQVYHAVGLTIPIVAVAAAIALLIWSDYSKKQKRLAYLRSKYRNEDVVQKIVNCTVWQGQSAEQLTDTLGNPAAVDQHVLKTKN